MTKSPLLAVLAAGVCAGSSAGAQPRYGPSLDPELEAVRSHIRQRRIDRIPAIDEPAFVDSLAAAGFLNGADLVVGIEGDGVAKAYPVKFLNGREVVNDSLGCSPIVVTWCPIVARSVVYDPRIGAAQALSRAGLRDTSLAFGVSGILRHSALVMYDRATVSLWTLEGIAIAGPLEGMRLHSVPSERTSWRSWLDRHAESQVMAPPPPGRERRPLH